MNSKLSLYMEEQKITELIEHVSMLLGNTGIEIDDDVKERAIAKLLTVTKCYHYLEENRSSELAGEFLASCLATYILLTYNKSDDDWDVTPRE